jgi:hypothetical protein
MNPISDYLSDLCGDPAVLEAFETEDRVVGVLFTAEDWAGISAALLDSAKRNPKPPQMLEPELYIVARVCSTRVRIGKQ